MDRLDEHQVPLPGRRARRRDDVLRRRAAAPDARRRLSRVRTAEDRDPDRHPRLDASGDREPGDGTAGAGAQRRAQPGRAAFPITGPALADRDDLRSRDGSHPLAPARPGTAAAGGTQSAHLGRAPGDAATAVVDQPGHEDRDPLRGRLGVGHRSVDDGLLEAPRPAAACARRGQRGDLGRAHRHAGRAGRARPAPPERRHPEPGDGGDLGRARLGAAAVHQRLGRGQGRLHRHPQPAAHRSAHPPHPEAGRPGRGGGGHPGRPDHQGR